MLINNLLEKSASRFPDKRAVYFNQEWKTYLEIDRTSNKVSNFLIRNGFARGNRAALLLANSFDYIVTFFGILKAGGVAVPLNPESTCSELKYYIEHSDAQFIFSNSRHQKKILNAVLDQSALKHCIFDSGGQDLSADAENRQISIYSLADICKEYDSTKTPIPVIDIDLAMIVYTSGSTSKPKGVMLSHLNVVSNMRSIVQYLNLTEDDRVMAVLPFFYIYGKSLLLSHFLCGASIIVENHFTFPNTVLDAMQDLKATGFAGVPYNFNLLLNRSKLKQITLSNLRYVTQAGSAMAPCMQTETAEVFSPAKLYIMYGATEASPRISYLEPEMLLDKLGSVGKAVPNVEILITDESGKALQPETEGEVAVRGSNIMQGYWKDPQSTSKVLKNGLYYTGDIGKMDGDGYLFITGRKKDMIKIHGFQVSPKEIEEKLIEIPEIEEAAVIGYEDESRETVLKAFIVKKEKRFIHRQKILKYLNETISPYKIPKFIEFVEKIPKNKSGKMDKLKLKSDVQ